VYDATQSHSIDVRCANVRVDARALLLQLIKVSFVRLICELSELSSATGLQLPRRRMSEGGREGDMAGCGALLDLPPVRP
jgi:hypothetical protein